jgi:pilus assembly protein Flp/PilA
MFAQFNKALFQLAKDESGLTSVEYAVLGGIVVAALVGIGTAFETNLTNAFNNLFSLI